MHEQCVCKILCFRIHFGTNKHSHFLGEVARQQSWQQIQCLVQLTLTLAQSKKSAASQAPRLSLQSLQSLDGLFLGQRISGRSRRLSLSRSRLGRLLQL